MAIKLAVFDMAGTTVYVGDAVTDCLRAALQNAGLTVDRTAVKAVMGLPKPEALRRLIDSSPGTESLKDRIQEIHADFVERSKRFYASDPGVREMPGASATLAVLRKTGIKVALDTGFSRDIVQVLLDRLGWIGGSPLIDASVCSDEVPRGRPFPDMIHFLMRKLGINDPSEVAKVGDTPVDLQEGASAACGLNIAVTNGTHSRAELEKYPHTHLVDLVSEVPSLILASGGRKPPD
jgi:phosphonatase-like hydrolase